MRKSKVDTSSSKHFLTMQGSNSDKVLRFHEVQLRHVCEAPRHVLRMLKDNHEFPTTDSWKEVATNTRAVKRNSVDADLDLTDFSSFLLISHDFP